MAVTVDDDHASPACRPEPLGRSGSFEDADAGYPKAWTVPLIST